MRPIFSGPALTRPLLPAAIVTLAMLLTCALAFSQGTANPGSTAALPGTPVADPGFQPLSNPLNRNPARQTVTVPDIRPAANDNDSSTRPTLGAVTTPDNRDTTVTPDTSRDSTTNPVANPSR